MSKKELIDITPVPEMLDGISAGGRKISENLMDLIDNSLDAMYRDSDGEQLYNEQKIDVTWHKTKNLNKGYKKYENKRGWLIRDEGSGIENPADIFTIGKSNKVRSLGRYGFGTKTATLGLGDRIFIRTTKQGSTLGQIIAFELKDIMSKKHGNWKIPIEKFSTKRTEHYTEIFVTDCKDKKPNFNKIYNELARTYYKHIDDNVKINFEKKILDWKEPEVYSNEELKKLKKEYSIPDTPAFREVKSSFEIIVKDKKTEHRIKGWMGIMKKSNHGLDGFDIFWAKRKLKTGSRLGIPPQNTISNIYGQIFVDINFPVNAHKTDIDRGSGFIDELEKEITKHVKTVLNINQKLQSGSKKKSNPKVKRLTDKHTQILSTALNLALKGLMKDLNILDKLNKRSAKENAKDFGPVDINTTPELNEKEKKKILKKIITKPRERTKRQRSDFVIPTTGKRIKLEHMPTSLGEDQPLSSHKFYAGTLHITSNTDHPYYISKQVNSTFRKISELHLENMIYELPRWLAPQVELEEATLRDALQRSYSKFDTTKL